ncbi:hypothetical protein [Pontivivens insulae]|uniref:Uncharacterized protein n=1 Tax=Pontivivens insulae TaxID=1639689 RepID=A0A2R8AER2_9RHOB|nr:hypothetical protein [Pontivivens insulae]RED11978.1 hypothetical protein DFR53_2690 [Pontivivens insulae]SPF30734.1 hypothetical protein POI8812_03076 [Pontivivens insulae]
MRQAINGVFVLGFAFVALIFATAPEPAEGEVERLAHHMIGSVQGASGAYFDTLYAARNAAEPAEIRVALLD